MPQGMGLTVPSSPLQVWRYLNLFALEYDLHRRVRLNTVVDKAIPLPLQGSCQLSL